MTKSTDIRETPQKFFDALDREFHFDIDVCASEENTKVADCYLTEVDDGLKVDWHLYWGQVSKTAWMNPPYSDITPWLQKVEDERYQGVTTVALLPASVSAKWFHRFIWDDVTHTTQDAGIQIRFPRKRLVFGPHFTGAKWPSMIVIFRSINQQL